MLKRRLHRLSRLLRERCPYGTSYVKPGAKPEQRILSRAEAIAAHDVDLSPARTYQPAFSFHVPEQAGAFAERIRWNAQLLDQLLEESAAAGVPVALLYVPLHDVFLHAPAPNPLADSIREVAARRGALWFDLAEVFAARARPEEFYHAYDGHLNAAGHAAVAELLERELRAAHRDDRGQASDSRKASSSSAGFSPHPRGSIRSNARQRAGRFACLGAAARTASDTDEVTATEGAAR